MRPMVFALYTKWIMAPGLVVFGVIYCRFAYLKWCDTTPFYVWDLFKRIPIHRSSQYRLLIEGLFCICLGLAIFAVF